MQEIQHVDGQTHGAAEKSATDQKSLSEKSSSQPRRWLWQGKVIDAFWKFATLFSFIVNFILVLVLLFTVGLLFDIKNAIAQPLVGGLYGSFVQMDSSHIVTTIEVNDTLPVQFDLPLKQQTDVVISRDTLITGASVSIQGGVLIINDAPTTILLRAGTPLPIQLDLIVPVSQTVPVHLIVPVNIALDQTDLHMPFSRLRNLFYPYSNALDKLPSSWGAFLCQSAEALCGLSSP
jgi:hypothetical protein